MTDLITAAVLRRMVAAGEIRRVIVFKENGRYGVRVKYAQRKSGVLCTPRGQTRFFKSLGVLDTFGNKLGLGDMALDLSSF